MSPTRSLSRRRVLGALAVLGTGSVSGCYSQMGGNVSDLSVYNSMDQTTSVALEVSRSADGVVVLDETFELAAEADRRFPHPFAEDGSKHLSLTVDGTRHASAEWTESAGGDASGLSVAIYADEISIGEIVA